MTPLDPEGPPLQGPPPGASDPHGAPADGQLDRRILASADGQFDRHLSVILDEFRRGFEAVASIDRPAVTIFGSARIPEDDPVYGAAMRTAAEFVHEGFAVVTGGGPGLMAAANRGAQEAGGLSVGFNIELPHEQFANPWVDIGLTFHHFYARKVMFMKAAEGFVVFPGGFGTMDELFEALTLIQTDTIRHFPVVLFGRDHWADMLDWIRRRVLADGLISPGDLDLLMVTDDPAEAVHCVVECYRRNCSHIEAADG
jgi:uncharacterized protein (TIGR00730 family)